MVRRWYRTGKRRGDTEDYFYVDGAQVETYGTALEALNTPPVFNTEEIEALKQIGDEPADWRKVIGWETLHFLASKGAIEWGPPGRCRRTATGRSAIAGSDLTDQDIEAIYDAAVDAALHCASMHAATNPYPEKSQKADIWSFAFQSAYADENGR